MGNHTRIIPLELPTPFGIVKLKESDLFVELTAGDKSLHVERITPKRIINKFCIIKTFSINIFDGVVILWQIGEGVISHNHIKRFGYDKECVPEIIYETVAKTFFDKAIDEKQPIFIIVSKNLKDMLTYKEVITKM